MVAAMGCSYISSESEEENDFKMHRTFPLGTRSLRTLRLAVWVNHNSTNNDGNSSVHQSRMIDTEKAIGFWDKVQKNPWYCAPLT